jgi:hypothetical protein
MALSRHARRGEHGDRPIPDSGKIHITYKGVTCAYVDMDLLTRPFPKWEFDAEWRPPALRGLTEPVLGTPSDLSHA